MTITLGNAVEDWCAYRAKLAQLGLVADSTWENQTAIGGTIKAGLGNHALEDLRKSHIELWAGARLRHCAPVTVRGELNVLRQIINWCVDEQLLTNKPRFPTISVPATEEAMPSDEAFRWHLAHLPQHHAAALEFMMLTGLSPHELERLETRDGPGFAGAPSQVTQIQIGMRPDFPVKQASRRRIVPLGGRAMVIWIEETMGTLPTFKPFPTMAGLQKAMRRLVRDALASIGAPPPAGADSVTPKMMRKWFASKVSNDQPEHVLQRLMGHAPGSPITRRHYVRSSDEQLAGAVEELKA